ncbi:GWxTD domain-containing protein [candidate division WOR-3 bacterium]|nr:GWxTD domain-containing protein [candidate division WOR-3 bacterium]
MIFFLFFQIEYQAMTRVHRDSLQELVTYINIPRQKLQYISAGNDFRARYEIQLTLYDKTNRQLTGDYWRRQVSEGEEAAGIADSVKLHIPADGDYFVLRILDLHAGEIFTASQKLAQARNLAGIHYTVKNDTMYLRFTVLNQHGNIDSIAAAIEDLRSTTKARRGTHAESLMFYVGGLPIDDYELKLFIYAEQRKIDESIVPVKVTRPFYLDEKTWSLKVDQLQYIATPSEMKVLKQSEVSTRDSLWTAFWKNLDPTPNTAYNEKEVEYFERIAYAEKNFSGGDRGWRSDRARIFVKHGSPDEIQRYPYEIDSFPYEVWLYYRDNLRFIFVDRHGFGQYVLANPTGSGVR